ncbi:MAG TPA: tetratricopeptide repeat protein, partial [Blastocatellia bacterium]|nr:tetratricopeptide repeat protein [Blastocatellia bacterium]
AHYYLGKAQALLDRPEPALGNLKKVIDANQSGQLIESAYYQLARVYRRLGQPAEAQAALASLQKLRTEREERRGEKLEEIKKRQP